MSFTGRSLVLALSLFGATAFADTVELEPNHPDRYVVVKGDTLWDISARFLRDPWRWPSVWNINEQIKNPHLIYPGDVIVLNYVDGKPELNLVRNQKLSPPDATQPVADTAPASPSLEPSAVVERVSADVRMEPQVRVEPFGEAIPTINPAEIAPFLTQPLVVGREELKRAGYVTVGLDERVALGTMSQFYARGLANQSAEFYAVFRQGSALRHPETREVLGYEAIYLGEARLLQPGDPAKLEVVSVKQEIVPTDRLLAVGEKPPLPYYYPRAPQNEVHGRILSALNAVAEFGPGTIVSVSLGRRDGMEEGHVLRILRHIGKRIDPITARRYKIPDEESGLLMVFRTYEKVSYALVMNANRPIHILDAVRTP